MEPLGYRNAKKVLELSQEGRFLKTRGGKLTPNMTAYGMLLTMAEITYDWPPTEENRRRRLPSRVYDRGWGYLVDQFSMGIVDYDTLTASPDVDELIRSRRMTSVNRISQTAKFLKEQGLIKEIRKPDIRREIPSAWLLLLGDDAENREVEAYARECLRL